MHEHVESPAPPRTDTGGPRVGFDRRQALGLARACAAAYLRTPADIAADLQADHVSVFAGGATAGFTARLGADVLLVFRGTVSLEEEWNRSLVQWLVNLNFGQMSAGDYRLHQGFARALDIVWERVRGHVTETLKAGGRLWVAGHSQGGALATLSAARLQAESIHPQAVYTFGAPRVGDRAFTTRFRPTLHRVENGNDLVCHLPPSPGVTRVLQPLLERLTQGRLNWNLSAESCYAPAGRLTFIDWDGVLRADVSPDDEASLEAQRGARLLLTLALQRNSLLEDHRITSYLARLTESLQGFNG